MFDRWDCANINDSNNNYGLTIDDIRLYDTILTQDQIASIVIDGLANDAFAKDAAKAPENDTDTTPEGEETNPPETDVNVSERDTQNTENDTNTPDDTTTNSGCASFVGCGAIVLSSVICGIIFTKKKENE